MDHSALLAKTLQEISSLQTFPLKLEQALDKILDSLGHVITYDSASILLFNETGLLELAAGRGIEDLEQMRQIVAEIGSDKIQQYPWMDQKAVMLSDTHADERWQIFPGSEYIRSWVGAPLLVKGQLIGVLNIDSCTPNTYDSLTGEVMMVFANLAAIAIENARLFEAEHAARAQAEALQAADKQHLAELETVRRASLSLTASLDLPQVLAAILKGAMEVLPEANSGNIYLYNYDGDQQLKFGAFRSAQDFYSWPIPGPRPNGLTNTVARTGEVIVVSEMRTHPLFSDVQAGWNGSVIGLPLKIGQNVVGVMNIDFKYPRSFLAAELHTLRLLGDQAAIAIENARLFQQAATERRHLSLLYDISRELSSTVDQEEILRLAISLTCQALDGLVGMIFLYHPEEDQLYLRAMHGSWTSPIDEIDARLGLSSRKGLEGWVLRNRQVAIVPDVTRNRHWARIPGLSDPARSAISAPILEGEEILGVLTVLGKRVGAFSADHRSLLQAICHEIGLALVNARHHEEVERLAGLLSAEQKQLESLVQHLPVGVLLLDQENHLLKSNPLGEAILRDFQSDHGGPGMSRLGPYSLEALFNLPAGQQSVELVLEEPRRIVKVEPRLVGGEDRNRLLMLEDITQERENQVRTHMQERLATVGQLAAGIAHDFNNITAAILAYTNLLMREPGITATNQERLLIIEQQVERAASLIHQILDFSRKSVMEQYPLDLLPFIKELDKMLARVLPENIRLELNYQPGAYPVKADPTRLQQVFMNLALNARDAMPQGGYLRFELFRFPANTMAETPIWFLPEGDWICIYVRDTGVGISEEALPHIYEPFFTTKPARQGNGLGLAQVYGIVKQHGGYIHAESQPGHGTCFTICLPRYSERQDEEPTLERPESLEGAGERVLLVEDDPSTREALRNLLEAQNYRVVTASNGLEALSFFERYQKPVSLVISDLIMPEMGGVELYERLKLSQPGVKLLFITGHPLDKESRSLLETGGVPWLQKPFSAQRLGRAVKSLIRET